SPMRTLGRKNARFSRIFTQERLTFSGLKTRWRRGRDSNPRYPLRYVRFRGGSFQPLTHLSASDEFTFSAVVSPSFPEGRLPSKQQLTPAPKKRLEHFRAASRQHSTPNLNPVI